MMGDLLRVKTLVSPNINLGPSPVPGGDGSVKHRMIRGSDARHQPGWR